MSDDDRKRGPREKLSWRELDKRREQGGSRDRDRDRGPKPSSPAALAAQKSYRAALERAFEAGTLGELAKTLNRSSEPPAVHPPPVPPEPPPAPPTALPPAEARPESAAPAAEPHAAPAPPPRDPDRENRQKLIARIREAEGREPISRAVDTFLKQYGKLPDDFEVLTKVLSHRDDDRVRAALVQIRNLMAHEKPRRARALVAQLRFLEETHGDPDIQKDAASLRLQL